MLSTETQLSFEDAQRLKVKEWKSRILMQVDVPW